MPDLQNRLMLACSRLGLTCTAPYVFDMDGITIEADAYIKEVGGQAGMIIVSDYDLIKSITDKLTASGYGWSVLDSSDDDSTEDEIVASYEEIFSDWGWNTAYGDPPAWYQENIQD